MAAATQTGVEWKLGFDGAVYTGYMPEDLSETPESDEEIIKDEDNATTTVIDYDQKTVLAGTFLIKSTGSITPPAKNSLISMQGPNDTAAVKRRVTSSSVAFTRGVSKLSLTLMREVSMAATYDA